MPIKWHTLMIPCPSPIMISLHVVSCSSLPSDIFDAQQKDIFGHQTKNLNANPFNKWKEYLYRIFSQFLNKPPIKAVHFCLQCNHIPNQCSSKVEMSSDTLSTSPHCEFINCVFTFTISQKMVFCCQTKWNFSMPNQMFDSLASLWLNCWPQFTLCEKLPFVVRPMQFFWPHKNWVIAVKLINIKIMFNFNPVSHFS